MPSPFNPHPYQRRAIDWIMARDRSALFLDMGLGKTAITLNAIATLIDLGEVSRALVVAPKKVAEATWSDEAAKWDATRHLRVTPVIGTAQRRRHLLALPADIDVIGRDSLVWLWQELGNRWPYDAIILDELSSFKNPSSQRFKALKQIARLPGRIIGLTGTPAPNGLIDLWAQIWPLDHGERLGRTVTEYRSRYFNAYVIPGVCTKYSLRPGMDAAIRDKIADLCLSMQAADFLSLPPIIEIDTPVHLYDGERRAYQEFEREMVLTIADTDITAASAAALMTKLAQYTSGAIYSDPPENTAWADTTPAKIETLTEIVEAADSPVLIFYQYKHEVPRITRALRPRRVEVYRDADTLRRWNARKIDILLAHPASTAFGLNMQAGGHTIIWTNTGFNLELYLQANARLHRQGQQQPVRVYRLICPDTVDAIAAAAITRKDNQQTALLRALSHLRAKHQP